MTFWNDFIILLIAIFVHELGHALGLLLVGRTPKFKFVKDMFIYCPAVDHLGNKLNKNEGILVGILGIFSGLIVILFTSDTLLFTMAYLFGCFYDFVKVYIYIKNIDIGE